MKQFPEVGDLITLEQHEDTAIEDVEIIYTYGAARLLQARLPDGSQGVIAVQPNGGWWLVRQFEDPADEAWRGED